MSTGQLSAGQSVIDCTKLHDPLVLAIRPSVMARKPIALGGLPVVCIDGAVRVLPADLEACISRAAAER